MRIRRRHAFLALIVLAVLPLTAADCPGDAGDDAGPGADRASCEAVCTAEDGCGVRSKAECLAALCSDTGFNVVDADAGTSSNLADLSSNDCEKSAGDCGALVLCSCGDACARVDECTGNPDDTCVDNCDNLIPNDPSLYLENRCKMESACADVPACGSSSSGQ